jgi:benzoyl-CoA reductase/2-hydroxyglutaryl-CoA dehydratase subunit BcrC/BadD/HgdB
MVEINQRVYRYYSRKEPVVPSQKVAWITSLAPVELLEAFDIAYVYPESYAAVISASGKEQECFEYAVQQGISLDCCSYSACFQGCLARGAAPRGMPPKPDIIITANNQCNTLPNWWNVIAEQYGVPLVFIDFPGECGADKNTRQYVDKQYQELVALLSQITGKRLDVEKLASLLEVSKANVALWKNCLGLLPDYEIPAGVLFDMISPLILARCNPLTSELYHILSDEYAATKRAEQCKRIYWLGYPFWYQRERVLPVASPHVVGANYLLLWNLRYEGADVWETLYNAYNFAFFNLTEASKSKIIRDDIRNAGARALVVNHNKSCKRDLVTFYNEMQEMPAAVIESDMIDRNYMNAAIAEERVNLLLSTI